MGRVCHPGVWVMGPIPKASSLGELPEEGALWLDQTLQMGEAEKAEDWESSLHLQEKNSGARFSFPPPPHFFFFCLSFCHSLVLSQWQQQWSCLNDFTDYYSGTQLLTFPFCHFVATQKVHFSSIMFWELCQWAIMAFNINLIINNYIICGIISTSVYCVILQYRFWKWRPGLSKSSLDYTMIFL